MGEPRHPRNIADGIPTGGRQPRKPGPVKFAPVTPARGTAKPKAITSMADDHCPNCFRWSTWNGNSCSSPDCNAVSTAHTPDASRLIASGKTNTYSQSHAKFVKRERKRTVVNKIRGLFRKRR